MGAMRRWVRCASLLLLTFGSLLCFHAAAMAQTGPTGATGATGPTGATGSAEPAGSTAAAEAPKLVAAQTTIQMEIEKFGLTDTKQTSGIASGHVLISNQGTGTATGLQVSARFTNGTVIEVEPTTEDGEPLADIGVNEAVPVSLSFNWAPEKGSSGTFLFEAENGPPLTVPFTVREAVSGSVFGLAALLAACASVVLTVITYATLKIVPRDSEGKQRPKVGYQVYPGGSWSFTGSLATSLTAVGAILGTLLAASGFVSEVLPGLATGLFAGVNVGYLLIVALSAAVYTASHDKEAKPTYLALLLAACVTLWAVIGELMTMAQLAVRGGVPQFWLIAAGIVVLVVLLLYERSSILQVLLAPKPPPPKEESIVPPDGATPDEIAEFLETAAATPIVRIVVQHEGPSALL